MWTILRDILVCTILSAGIGYGGLRLETADWTQPFSYEADSLAMLPVVKEVVEHGTYRTNPRLGLPGEHQLYDFPISEPIHLTIVWMIGLVTRNAVVTFNLFYFITFCLTTITSFFACRRLSLSWSASMAVALLYAFTPYHMGRGFAHYFLSAYYVIPWTAVLCLEIAQGRWPFFRATPEGARTFSLRTRDSAMALLIAVMTASAGAYYAFFACYLLVIAGLYATASARSIRPLVACGLIVSLIVAVGAAQYIPTFLFQYRNGKNTEPFRRTSEEAETYPLKVTHLVLPVAGHNLRALENVQAAYDTPTRVQQNENRSSALGLVGAVGFFLSLAVVLFPTRSLPLVRPLGVLTLSSVFLGMSGGIGSLYSLLVSPQIRALNRISIYIAFFALVASCRLLDGCFRGWGVWLRVPVFALVVVFGIWDQTGNKWFRSKIANERDAIANVSRNDAAFFSEWERTHPDSTVFCLPFIAFPESNFVGRLGGYENVRGYLHTKTARWSYGAMRGREDDLWQREVVLRPAPLMLDALIYRGFDTLFLDLRGYANSEGSAKKAELFALLGSDCPVETHPDGWQQLIDLRPFRERRKRELGPEYELRARREREAVRFLWLDGFISFQDPGEEYKQYWCRTDGSLVILNPGTETITVRLKADFRTEQAGESQLEIAGPVWRESLALNRSGERTERTLTIPPGRHLVGFHCRLSPDSIPKETRKLAFAVEWIQVETVR